MKATKVDLSGIPMSENGIQKIAIVTCPNCGNVVAAHGVMWQRSGKDEMGKWYKTIEHATPEAQKEWAEQVHLFRERGYNTATYSVTDVRITVCECKKQTK